MIYLFNDPKNESEMNEMAKLDYTAAGIMRELANAAHGETK